MSAGKIAQGWSGGSGRCGDNSRILESAALRYLSFVTVSSLRYVEQFSLSPELFIRVYKTAVYFLIFFGKPLGPVVRRPISA